MPAFLLTLAAAMTGPIIDVHRHGSWPWSEDAPYRAETLAEMDSNHVRTAVLSITDYDDIAEWQAAAPTRLIVAAKLPCPRNLAEPRYNCFPSDEGWVKLDWLEEQVKAGRIRAIHELSPNYYGISVANPRLDPYFALAHRHRIPVGIHTQRGPAAGSRFSSRSDPNCCPDYDPAMGNPALLRPVLDRYPGLRVWIQHVGSGRGDHGPFWEETLALLRDYPNVYLDLSITNGAMPVEQYEASLARLIGAGFGDRIMFGSDNLPIAPILKRLAAIDWLTDAQRRAILHDNAARFFGLDDARERTAGGGG